MQQIELNKILVVQTAFAGDVVLTLPLVQVLKKYYPSAAIDILVIPRVADLLTNHPAINEVLIFDKQGKDSGIAGFLRQVKIVRGKKYDIAFVPHRSLRSAVLVRLAGIKRRIGFDKSSGRFLYTDVVHYQNTIHEINRNLLLLVKIGIETNHREYPKLYPSFHDRKRIGLFLSDHGIQHANSLIGVAPGSVWNTKRWLKERFIELVRKLTTYDYRVVLIGGKDDESLCCEIRDAILSKHVYSAAGKLTLLQSAELIQRCKILISNDSAPMHLAVAVGTRVVAIFGATAPEFGFAPYGENDIVVETKGLSCRPCSIHGGDKCPTGTFDCMKRISSDDVLKKVLQLLEPSSVPSSKQ